MSDPLSTALATFLETAGVDPSLSVTMAGFILGAVLTIALLIAIEWSIGGKMGKSGDATFFISAMLGIIISTGIGWFPLWVPLLAVFFVVLILLKPFGTHLES